MSSHEPRITLELTGSGARPLRGRLIDETGSIQHFRGWLELITALESWSASGVLGGEGAEEA